MPSAEVDDVGEVADVEDRPAGGLAVAQGFGLPDGPEQGLEPELLVGEHADVGVTQTAPRLHRRIPPGGGRACRQTPSIGTGHRCFKVVDPARPARVVSSLGGFPGARLLGGHPRLQRAIPAARHAGGDWQGDGRDRPGEVVVCDNNSSDATAAIAAAAGARVVFEANNQFWPAPATPAPGPRAAATWSSSTPTPRLADLLRRAVEAMAQGGAAGGGSTMAMELYGRHTLFAHLFPLWNRLSRRLRLAAGGFIFARRDAFAATGGFFTAVYAAEELFFSRAVRRWGAVRGLDFVILEGDPPRTSGRKADWFPAPLLLGATLLLLVFPFLLRSRAFCWIWYRRPRV